MSCLCVAGLALGCTTCDPELRAAIFDGGFVRTLLSVVVPVPVAGAVLAAVLYRLD